MDKNDVAFYNIFHESIERMVMQKRSLEFLKRLVRAVSSDMGKEDFFENILDSMIDLFKTERGALFLYEGDRLWLASGRALDKATIKDAKVLSQTAVNGSIHNREVIYSLDAQNDARFKHSQSVFLNNIRSIICAPLLTDERVIGAIYMDCRITTHLFSDYEIDLFKTACSLIAGFIDKSLAYRRAYEKFFLKRYNIIPLPNQGYLVAESIPMRRVLKRVEEVSKRDSNILLLGETGVGKGAIARLIHEKSPRKKESFISSQCNVPETLLESDLFGYKRGAFTDAKTDKKGLVEEADKGTLFLDEIANVPLSLQAKLLGIIEEKTFRRLGETTLRKVDIRIISASNKDLESLIKRGEFREDLYYRLNTITIKIPPLRERKEDIPILARCFLNDFSKGYQKRITGFSPEAMEVLLAYPWPGNVRQFKSAIEHAVLMAKGSRIFLEDLPEKIVSQKPSLKSLKEEIREFERSKILEALSVTQGNVTRAAKYLGINPRQLRRLIKRYEIRKETK